MKPGILQGVCPKCRKGRIFKGVVTMNPACPVCGLRFDREQGYFIGAMYISYGMSIPPMLLLYFLVRHFLPGDMLAAVAIAAVLYIPFVPLVFRHSRILWIYFDRKVDP